MTSNLLTYREAAERLNIAVSTLKKISKRELPRVVFNRKLVRIHPYDLDKYIQGKTRRA